MRGCSVALSRRLLLWSQTRTRVLSAVCPVLRVQFRFRGTRTRNVQHIAQPGISSVRLHAQEFLVHQCLKQFSAERALNTAEPLRLFEGQSQTGHFQILGAKTCECCIVQHATSEYYHAAAGPIVSRNSRADSTSHPDRVCRADFHLGIPAHDRTEPREGRHDIGSIRKCLFNSEHRDDGSVPLALCLERSPPPTM
jgi:hypothetical protein